MERQRREDELKNRSSKKGHDAEQSLLNRVGGHIPLKKYELVEYDI